MLNKPPFISIIITTYNRAEYLKQCLQSIQNALFVYNGNEKFEIIVLNNGCTDNTQEQLNIFKNTLPLKVLYIKDNIKFTRGFLKCMSYAKGEYCWILGDDDYIVGNLSELVQYLKQKKTDITLINHYFYLDSNSKIKIMKKNCNFLLKNHKTIYSSYPEYIYSINHPNAFFTHVASVIFKKELWDLYFSQNVFEKYKDSESIHTFVFLSILKNAKLIGYFTQQLIALRSGASSEDWQTEEGRYHRICIDVEHFTEMVKEVFNEKSITNHFKKIMLKKSISILILGTKIKHDFSISFYFRVFKLLLHYYKTFPFFWYFIFPIILTPRIIFLLSYKLFLLKKSRSIS